MKGNTLKSLVGVGILCTTMFLVGCEDSGSIYLDDTNKANVTGIDYGKARAGLDRLDSKISDWNSDGDAITAKRSYDADKNYCYVYLNVNDTEAMIKSYNYESTLSSMSSQVKSCLFGSGVGCDVYVYDMYGNFVRGL